MGAFSGWHMLILGLVVLVLFGGKGKISSIMGDFADGIKSFKKGMKDDEVDAVTAAKAAEAKKAIEAQSSKTIDQVNTVTGTKV
jgi:sec-independent protein translocase protein TatA